MATGRIILSPSAARAPDGTSGNAAPAFIQIKSSASAPSIHLTGMAFDASTDEMVYWAFEMPGDYASSPTLKVQFYVASTQSGVKNTRWEGRIAAQTPNTDSADLGAKALDTTNSAGLALTSGQVAGYPKTVTITLTNNDSLAAGDLVILMLRRDADGTTGTDDCTSDAVVTAVTMEYTTT